MGKKSRRKVNFWRWECDQPPDVSKPAVKAAGGGGEGVGNQAVEAVQAVHQEPSLCAAFRQHVPLVGEDHVQHLLQLILARETKPRTLNTERHSAPSGEDSLPFTWQVKYLCWRLCAALFSSSPILTASSSSSEKILCSSTRLRSTICRCTFAEASSCRTRSARWSRLWLSLCSFSRRTLQRRSSWTGKATALIQF